MRRWAVGVAAVLAVFGGPSAMADPGPIPDLSDYTSVNVNDYPGYDTYPGTGGVQFSTPAGYRCRLTYNMKPNVSTAQCWGSLPATSFNLVSAYNQGVPAKFDNVDLARQEEYRTADGSPTPVPISPGAYKLLPAGSRISYPDSGACAASAVTTTCEVAGHGFVLDPQGNRTF
jgi:hypothetical protein